MQRFGRLRAVVVTAALVMTVGAQGTAVALPSPVPFPAREFASSFERVTTPPTGRAPSTPHRTAAGGPRGSTAATAAGSPVR